MKKLQKFSICKCCKHLKCCKAVLYNRYRRSNGAGFNKLALKGGYYDRFKFNQSI